MDIADGGNLDQVSVFGHQLQMKIRSDRKLLLSTDFSKRWVKVMSLDRVNGANLYFDTMGQSSGRHLPLLG